MWYLLSAFDIKLYVPEERICRLIILFLKGQGKIRHYSITHAISKGKPRITAKKLEVFWMFLISQLVLPEHTAF